MRSRAVSGQLANVFRGLRRAGVPTLVASVTTTFNYASETSPMTQGRADVRSMP